MEKVDGRRIGAAAQEERKRTILRMKRAGFRTGAIITATGCTRQQISALWIAYNNFKGKNAEEAVSRNRQTGRKEGEGRTLNIRQEEAVQKILTEKYPDQLKFDFALWTREAVKKLIEKKYGILMPIRTVGEYLRRWGFTPQKPVKYAYERDAEKVKEWKEKEYKAIRKRAKRVKAEIYWGDETTIKAGDVRGRGYAPAGKTPVVNRTEKKENVSMISAITNQGKVHWKLYEGSINGDRVIEFVKRLIKTTERKVFLIMDNAKTHHGKKLKEWVEENRNKIELYYLPPYSPDLNPDEHINADVKYGVGSKRPKRSREEIRKAASAQMKMIQRNPRRVMKYFHDPAIQYAA